MLICRKVTSDKFAADTLQLRVRLCVCPAAMDDGVTERVIKAENGQQRWRYIKSTGITGIHFDMLFVTFFS